MTGKSFFRLAAGLIMSAALFIGGCGGSDDPAARVSITPDKTETAINTDIVLTVVAKDAKGVAVPAGTVITFTTTAGTLSANTVTTADDTGTVTVTVTSATAGTATVKATSAVGGSDTQVVSFSDPNAIASVALTSDKATAAKNTNISLTATVTTVSNTPAPDGTVVTFATTAGTLSAPTATTTGGTATVTITSAAAATPSVTASAGGKTSPALNLTFDDPDKIGTVTLAASKTSASIGGDTITLTATVKTVVNTNAPNGTVVTFTKAGTAGVLSATTATTTDGIATVTLTSNTVGTATATATAGGKSSTTGTLTFADPNAIDTVTLVADKNSAGTGSTITYTATVKTVSNTNAPNGTVVTFTKTGVGTLSAASAQTNNGTASVTLTSNTVGNASVTAKVGTKSSAAVTVGFIAQPTQAIVKLATSGTLSAGTKIGAIDAILNYSTDKGLSITSANVVKSGVAPASSLLAKNVGTAGQVQVGLIDAETGVSVGEFATLTFTIATGNFPTASDFAVAAGATVGSNAVPSAPLPAISVVRSVTIQ